MSRRSVFVPEHTMDTLPTVITLAEPMRLLDWLHYEHGPWKVRHDRYRDWHIGREVHFAGAFQDRKEPGPLPPELEGPEPPNPGPCTWFDAGTGPIALTERQVSAVIRHCEEVGILLDFRRRLAIAPLEAGHFTAVLPLKGGTILGVHALGIPCTMILGSWQVSFAFEAHGARIPFAYKAPRGRSVLHLDSPAADVRVWVARDGTEHRPGARCVFLEPPKLYTYA